jgi:hypothetical protein
MRTPHKEKLLAWERTCSRTTQVHSLRIAAIVIKTAYDFHIGSTYRRNLKESERSHGHARGTCIAYLRVR